MSGPLKAFERLLELLCTLFALALGAIVVLISLDVLLRDLGLGALPWLLELTEYLLYAGTFLAAPWVLRKNGHVRVDILLASLPRPAAIQLDRAISAFGLGVSLILLYYGSAAVREAWREGMVQYRTWFVPEWILLSPIAICAALLSAEFVLRMLRVGGAAPERFDLTDRPGL